MYLVDMLIVVCPVIRPWAVGTIKIIININFATSESSARVTSM